MGNHSISDYYSKFCTENPGASHLEALKAVCQEFDIPNMLYLRVLGESPFDPRTVLFATYSEAWNERYQAEKYYLIDPLIHVSMTADKPTLWSEIPRDDVCIQKFFAEAAEYGVPDSGVTIPLDLTRPGCAVLTANTNFSSEEWQSGKDEFIADLYRMGQLFHQSVLNQFGDREYSVTLMPKEAELLSWLSMNRSVHEISQITGMSMAELELDLENSRKKLAANSNEAAIEAARLRKLI